MTEEQTKTTEKVSVPTHSICKSVWNTHKNNTPHEVLTRTYKVGEIPITPAWAGCIAFDFPQALFAVPTIQKYLEPFKYFRSGIRIKISINATTYHQGMLVTSFIHDREISTPADEYNLAEMSAMNSTYFNYSTSDTAELEYDWTCPVNAMEIKDADAGASIGTLVLCPLDSVLNAGGGSDNITATIMATFVDPEVAGYAVVPVSLVKKQATLEEKTKTRDHSLFGASSTPFSSVITPITATVDQMADLGDMILGGVFDKPTLLDSTIKVARDYGSEFGSGKGASVATKLQLNPTYKLGTLDYSEFFTTDKTFRNLAQQPMLNDIWNASGSTWNVFVPVTPSYLGNQNRYTEIDVVTSPDYLYTVGMLHELWSGTIRYHIKIITSSFVTGRLRVTFMITDPPDQYGGDFPTLLIDVHGTTETDFAIPMLYTKLLARFEDQAVGQLKIDWLIPPVSSSDTLKVTIAMFRAGGSNTVFAVPRTYTAASGLVEKQSSLKAHFKKDFSLLGKPKILITKGVTLTEQAGRISDYMKRYYLRSYSSPPQNKVPANKFLETFPEVYYYGDIPMHPYLASIFKYVRGGLREAYFGLPLNTMQYIGFNENNVFDTSASYYVTDNTQSQIMVLEIPYISDVVHLNKTLSTRYRSYYREASCYVPSSTSPTASTAYALSFADDRIMFYLLPPPRIVTAPAAQGRTKKT